MNKIDDTKKNKQSLPDKVSDGRTDINMLLKSLNDANNRLDIIERSLNAKKQVVNGHTSEMPDYKGDNRDHDARYATRKYVASVVNDIDPVTVVDTDSIDMSISGQEISAETIGLTAVITFVE
jgi:hypothetical protein